MRSRLVEGSLGLALLSCAAAPLEPLPPLAVATPAQQAPAPLIALPNAAVTLPATTGTATEGPLVGSIPAVSLGEIGGDAPVSLLAASSSGAWVALCEGEPPTAKLVLGAGPGEPIDELLAHDPSGRYVVVTKSGVTQLVDADDGTRVDLSSLGADVRKLRADYAGHRSLSFDAAGKYLAYLRQGATPQVVVRSLQQGSERVFPAGNGELVRLELSADAAYVTYDALREDTNHNGKLDWPAPEEPRKNACGSPRLPRFRTFAYQGRGDASVRGAVSLADGVVRDIPELLTPLGAALLLRHPDGSLHVEQGSARAKLSPASCAARVLFADADRGLVLASCAPPPPPKTRAKATAVVASGKREVWLFGAGFAKNLQSELYETATDREAVVGTRLVPLYPGSEASLLDLERRELLPLPLGSRVLVTSGALAVVWRDSDLYRYDAETKTEQRLARGIAKNPDLFQAGPAVLLSPFVVVGASGPALTSPPNALALTSAGFVLTGNVGGQGGSIRGPLHWVDARLPPPDGPPR